MIKELRRKLLVFMMAAFTLIIIMLVAVIVVVPESQKKSEIRRELEALNQSSESERMAFENPVAPPLKPESTTEGGQLPSSSSSSDTSVTSKSDLSALDNPPDKPDGESVNLEPPAKPDDSLSTPPERPAVEDGTVPSGEPRQEPEDIKERIIRDYGGNILTIEADSTGEITTWTSSREDYYSDDSVSEILSIILKSGAEFDYKGGYYFLRHRTPDGYSYSVLDSSSSVNDFERTLSWGIIGGVCAWILLFLLSLKLTKMMVKPVKEAFERQTEFISDASHELKTPIAVIQANADVLKNEIGDSNWLDYIINETHRMDKLVKDLLYLTSMDRARIDFTTLDFSRLVEGAVLPFEALAFERGRIIDSDIRADIKIRGDEGEMEKLVSILLSNALKYSYENSHITITLGEKYRSAVLKVRNEGEGIKPEDREKVFERFYRSDKARSREDGSYGLGLAMARTIADNHRARLTVESEYEKWAEFTFEIKIE